MKILYGTFLIFAILGLNACDRSSTIYYVVENQSDEQLRIQYVNEMQANVPGRPGSSLTYLVPNQKDTIYSIESIGGSKVSDSETSAVMTGIFIKSIMSLPDSSFIAKDVNLKKNWRYDKTGKRTAVIELTVYGNDFYK